MGLISPLFWGFIVAVIGIFPPGLINMTAAKISVQDGKNRALLFTSGAFDFNHFFSFHCQKTKETGQRRIENKKQEERFFSRYADFDH